MLLVTISEVSIVFNIHPQSPFVALISVGFMTMMIVILLFPTDKAPTSATMNYTVVVFGGIVILNTIYYFISGRYWFVGPARTVDDA